MIAPTIEELPSLVKDLTFPQEELIFINIGTSNSERLLQIGATLASSP